VNVASPATLSPTTPEALLAVLDAARDDTVRSALLSSASRELRQKLKTLLVCRRFGVQVAANIRAEAAAFAEFSRTLDTAVDDAARLAIIEAAQRDPQRGAAWVSEWQWRLTATAEDWRRRYLKMIGMDGYVEV
jgi:hypothetical protein